MNKIISLIIVFVFMLSDITNAHIQHHANLNEIKFEIFRNDKKVGYHNIIFSRDKEMLIVKNEIQFDIKKLGISFYKYQSEGTEVYDQDGLLFTFNSKTSDNKKLKYCNIEAQDNENYLIDGSSYKGTFNKDFAISSYWNHEILKKNTQISGITCKIRNQKVTFLKNESIEVKGQTTKTSVFNIDGKGLDTQIWYRKKDMAIVRQILNQKGIWRYEITSLN
tara:strand:+ start:50 stop:712 length:663 start_codon:yes stop_codon:yes gene_type:complete